MTDLTKINVPYGLLDEAYGPGTQEALRAWPHGWEKYTRIGWRDLDAAAFYACLVYRAKPAPVTKPSADWSLLPEWVRRIAQDQNGEIYCYDKTPHLGAEMWTTKGEYRRIDGFPFVSPGTCDWRDSLVERPEE